MEKYSSIRRASFGVSVAVAVILSSNQNRISDGILRATSRLYRTNGFLCGSAAGSQASDKYLSRR